MTSTLPSPASPSCRGNFVGGTWRAGADGLTYEKRNPAQPSSVVGTYVAPQPLPSPVGPARRLRDAARSSLQPPTRSIAAARPSRRT
jgi:hypothetical protein